LTMVKKKTPTGQGSCEKIPFSPPPWPSPVEGEGISSCISICFPSPLAGEGGVRGENPNFSHLQGFKRIFPEGDKM
jgi:hypothetical protein